MIIRNSLLILWRCCPSAEIPRHEDMLGRGKFGAFLNHALQASRFGRFAHDIRWVAIKARKGKPEV
jgi:hypothetical protein